MADKLYEMAHTKPGQLQDAQMANFWKQAFSERGYHHPGTRNSADPKDRLHFSLPNGAREVTTQMLLETFHNGLGRYIPVAENQAAAQNIERERVRDSKREVLFNALKSLTW